LSTVLDADGWCDDEWLYYTTDANMNVTALIDGDPNSGTFRDVLERYRYDPYGHVSVMDGSWNSRSASSYDNHILFAGYYRDTETGLYHVRERMYHPRLGAWLQRDPAGYADGMSLYEYCGSMPSGSTDAFGLCRRGGGDGPGGPVGLPGPAGPPGEPPPDEFHFEKDPVDEVMDGLENRTMTEQEFRERTRQMTTDQKEELLRRMNQRFGKPGPAGGGGIAGAVRGGGGGGGRWGWAAGKQSEVMDPWVQAAYMSDMVRSTTLAGNPFQGLAATFSDTYIAMHRCGKGDGAALGYAALFTVGEVLPANNAVAAIWGVDVRAEAHAISHGLPQTKPLDGWDRLGHSLMAAGKTVGLALVVCNFTDLFTTGQMPGLQPWKSPPAAPKPPGWNENWQYRGGSRGQSGKNWFDPDRGEWRWHGPDKWHSEPHWDHNPWDEWNSPWQNVPAEKSGG